jgi:hypothetical protein
MHRAAVPPSSTFPLVFRGHLRQQQTAIAAALNHQSMHARADVNRRDRFEHRENRNLNLEIGKFFRARGFEARILKRGRNCRQRDNARQWLARLEPSDASSQSLAAPQRHERSRRLAERARRNVNFERLTLRHALRDRAARNIQKYFALPAI